MEPVGCWDSATAECTSENRAPELLDAVLVIDGNIRSGWVAPTGERVQLRVSYQDADCNLACGTIGDRVEHASGTTSGWGRTPSSLGCAAADPRRSHLSFTVSSGVPGQHRARVWVSNGCGARSNELEFAITFVGDHVNIDGIN